MTEIFADGIGAIAVSNGVAQIELVQLRKTSVGEARLVPEPAGTLLIPVAGLHQMTQQLNETARRLQEKDTAKAAGAEDASQAASADEALTNL